MYSDTNAKRERTASAGSFESFNSNSLSSKSVSLGSLLDNVLEPEQSTVTKLTRTTPFPPLMQSSASPSVVSQDPFNPSFIQPPSSVTAIDLCADITQHPSAKDYETKPTAPSENSWNAFEDSNVNLSLASFENLPQKSEPKIPAYYTSTSRDYFGSSKVLMDFSELGFQRSTIEESAPSLPFNDVIAGSSFPSELPSMGITLPRPLGQKSTNPFDLPYDSDLESSTMECSDMGVGRWVLLKKWVLGAFSALGTS
ncbi:hypothetical protein AAC387_Pa01g1645 [Persea americana]